LLFAIVIVTLPFEWTEVTTCAGSPETHTKTGLSLFGHFYEAATVVTLTVLMFALLFLAPRARPVLATLAHLLSAFLCFSILVTFHFLATFTLGNKIRLLPAGYVGFGALVLAVVEAVVRFVLSALEAWWSWREQRRAPPQEIAT
jgi:hypothetical protein